MSRRRRLTRVLAAIAVLAAGSGLLAACGGGGAGGDGSGGGQNLTVAPGTFPVALDVHEWSAEAAVAGPMQHVMETLVARNGEEFVPELAESWTNPDELTWVFTLRSGVTFSDGTPLTAEDVRASAQRLIDIEGSLAPLWAQVESVEATDEHTLTVTTSQPLGTLLSTMTLLYIGQAGKMESEDYWRSPIGTGPYVVSEYLPDQKLTLSRNEKYRGERPTLDTITYTNMPEEAARITALSTGEVDYVGGIGADSVAQVESMDGVTYEAKPGWSYFFNWFNSSREPFDDPRVRQAMWYAVDVKSIVEDLFGSQAVLARAPIPQDVFGAPALEPYPYDPEKAKQLLAEAGYPDGFTTSLQWSASSGDSMTSFAQAFISAWANVGVTVEPLPKERAVWLEDLNSLNWDMNLQGNTVATGDADYTLGRLYLCSADRNGYCNPELDKLLNQAKASLDPKERIELYRQAAQIMWSDAVGIFPADRTVSAAYRNTLQNVQLEPSGRESFVGVSIAAD
ncbi:MAG TPA: ABC transporter substrate-binding protein [Pseudonocardia sp.]|nr:ABC transporter substrate-binding protein [Pseudonocardia sp.]